LFLAELLESGARHLAGPTAPPQGLYLVEVFYDNEAFSDQQSAFSQD
jgi:tRNA U38,U39,U40 pseudouridine synthase TruA